MPASALLAALLAVVGPGPGGHWQLAEVTCYCPCNICTDGDGVTANGTRTLAVPYALAADHSLPMGACVWLPLGVGLLDRVHASNRVFQVDDRGGGALDTEAHSGVLRLDLRVKEHWWARQWGRKRVLVYVWP